MSGTVLGFYDTSVDNRQNSWSLTCRTVPLLLPFFTQTACVCGMLGAFTAYTEMISLSQSSVCVCVWVCYGMLGALWFYCLYWNDLAEPVLCVCVCVCVWDVGGIVVLLLILKWTLWASPKEKGLASRLSVVNLNSNPTSSTHCQGKLPVSSSIQNYKNEITS